jgi:hypothetical protein
MEVLIGAIGSVNQSIAQRLGVTRQHFSQLTNRSTGAAKATILICPQGDIDQALERSRRG